MGQEWMNAKRMWIEYILASKVWKKYRLFRMMFELENKYMNGSRGRESIRKPRMNGWWDSEEQKWGKLNKRESIMWNMDDLEGWLSRIES